jgi:hypothetical protein
MTHCTRLPAGIAVLLLAGCSAAPAARDNLTGRVLLDGVAVADGIVTLHGPDGQDATSSILTDGTYSVDDPPLGTCQITLRDPPGAAGPAAHGDSPGENGPSRIPDKYARPGNGLQVEVKPGQTVFTIILSK